MVYTYYSMGDWLLNIIGRKIPWRLSRPRKRRQRERLRAVDSVIETVRKGLSSLPTPQTLKVMDQVIKQTPKESTMTPKAKYFVFSRKSKGYNKGAHKVPKWTR